jgi:hypothetical protein
LEYQYSLVKGRRTKRALGKKAIVGWRVEHENAVFKLKQELKKHLIRSYPDSRKDRHILLDASVRFWSLLITQTDPLEEHLDIQERNHELLYIQSGKFVKSQTNWHITSKEAYPLIVAARNARYLMHLGCDRPIHIWTDHKNLVSIFNPEAVPSFKRHTVERLLRWTLELNSIYYRIHHIEGQLNLLPDYISRHVEAEFAVVRKLRFTDRKKRKNRFDKILVEARRHFRRSRVQAHLAPDWPSYDLLFKWQHESFHCDMDNDQLLRVGEKVVIPTHYISHIIICAHYILGHCGASTICDLILSKFAFRITNVQLLQICKQFNQFCLHCRPRNYFRRVPLGTVLRAKYRFQVLHMDFLYIGPSTVGYQYLLVILDDYSSLLQLFPVVECDAHECVMGLLDFYGQHGFHVDVTFVSDNASYFTGKVLRLFCDLKGMKHRFSLAYAPFSNGVAERPNQEVLQVFRSLLSQKRLPLRQWPNLIGVVESILNHRPKKRLGNRNAVSVAHNISMDHILSGLEFSASFDNTIYTFDGSLAEKEFDALSVHFETWHHRYRNQRLIQADKLDAKYFNKYINFGVGDYVLVAQNPVRRKSKLHFIWQGPALIIEMNSAHVATIKFLNQDKTFRYHTCMLAFYDNTLVDQEVEVLEQFLFDSSTFSVEKFLELSTDPVTNELMVKVVWKDVAGLTSLEPFSQLYSDVPVRLLAWLRTRPDSPLQKRALRVFEEEGDITVEDLRKTAKRQRRKKKNKSI